MSRNSVKFKVYGDVRFMGRRVINPRPNSLSKHESPSQMRSTGCPKITLHAFFVGRKKKPLCWCNVVGKERDYISFSCRIQKKSCRLWKKSVLLALRRMKREPRASGLKIDGWPGDSYLFCTIVFLNDRVWNLWLGQETLAKIWITRCGS